jgi:predicted nucleic acid-binding protein
MTGKILLDTNVLVYIYAGSDPRKQAIAEGVADKLIKAAQAVVSTQVLAEFFNTATRKLGVPLGIAQERLARYSVLCDVLIITTDVLITAARGVIEHQLSFWDALLWATALLNQIGYILSEDFQDGIKLEGVRIVNPFTPTFDIGKLKPA